MLTRNLLHICAMNFLSRIFIGFTFVFVAVYLLGIGFSGLQAGFLISLLAVTTLFVSLPVGIINDRLDIRYTILLGYVLSSIFFFMTGYFQDFWIFMPAFFLGGLGFNVIETSYRNYVFKDREPRHEGKKFGTFTLGDTLGTFAGAISGMFMVFFLGFPATLMIIGAYFLALIPLLFWLEPVSISRTKLIQYETDFLHLNNILLAVILFLFTTHWGAERTSYALFLKDVLGLNEAWMGLYVAFAILFLGIAAFLFGSRIDHRTDFRRLFLMGLLVSGATHVLMTIPQVHISFLFRAAHEVGDGIQRVSLFFWLRRKFKAGRLGGDSGIFFVIMTLGEFTGSIIYGPIGFAYGYSMPLVISGITTMICAGMFYVFKRRLE
jgi:predicted MFS family arabinose efflux permease